MATVFGIRKARLHACKAFKFAAILTHSGDLPPLAEMARSNSAPARESQQLLSREPISSQVMVDLGIDFSEMAGMT